MFYVINILFVTSLLYSFNLLVSAENLNILGVVTSTSISNHIHASAIFDYLAKTGNAVTVISPFPQSRRVNHISLEDILEQSVIDKQQKRSNYNQYSLVSDNKEVINSNWFQLFDKYNRGLKQTEKIVRHKNFTELLWFRTPPLYTDVVILDYDYNEALIGLGAIYDCPVFILTKETPRGLLDPWSLSFSIRNFESLTEYFKQLIISLIEKIYVHFTYYKKQENLFKQFNIIKNSPSFTKLLEQYLSKIFITTITPYPLSSHVTITDNEDVTTFHINDRKQSYLQQAYMTMFPEALDNFIHTATNGIIYISFGTEFDHELFEDEIDKIISVLRRRKEKIIWSLSGNFTKTLLVALPRDKFYISEWLPQSNIFEHTNVKLFITNCGHLSLIESIYFEIPILGFPMNMEQKKNCEVVEKEHLGHIINFHDFTTYNLNKTIEDILDINARIYMSNVQRKSKEFNDKPMVAKNTIKTTIQNIIEHRKIFGLKRSFVRKKPIYKIFVMEPILIVIFILMLICLVFSILGFLLFLRHFHRIYGIFVFKKKCKFY